MINHPDCHWCKIDKNLCDNCINEMHVENMHTTDENGTQSLCLGRLCFHREDDAVKDRDISIGSSAFILNDDWIKNLKDIL